MLDYVFHGASSLVKRTVEDGSMSGPPNWLLAIFSLEGLLFLPIFLFTTYTLATLYPALAIVEDDDAPPTYQPLALDSENTEAGQQAAAPASEFPVTASVRRVHTLVKSISGMPSLFRGLLTLCAANFATHFLRVIFAAPLSLIYLDPLASIPAHLALVQLHTVWVHVVITPPNPLPFWKRLPPFGKTFRATVRPIMLYALAKEIARGVPTLIVVLVNGGRDMKLSVFPFFALGIFAFYLVLWFFVELPAQIALVRIQASLLPPEEYPIVPFDRSFGGRVNSPFTVGGDADGKDDKTHATLRDIWETLTKTAMYRVGRLVLKVLAINLGIGMAFGAVVCLTAVVANVPLTRP